MSQPKSNIVKNLDKNNNNDDFSSTVSTFSATFNKRRMHNSDWNVKHQRISFTPENTIAENDRKYCNSSFRKANLAIHPMCRLINKRKMEVDDNGDEEPTTIANLKRPKLSVVQKGIKNYFLPSIIRNLWNCAHLAHIALVNCSLESAIHLNCRSTLINIDGFLKMYELLS